MKKIFPHISASILTLVVVFVVGGFLFPEITYAQETTKIQAVWDFIDCRISPFECALKNYVTFLIGAMLKLASLLVGLGGIVLNGVVYYTVVQISQNYSNIPAISGAWQTIRDIANMGFIFILLYAAIRTILGIGGDTKKLIVRVIIVAILINFSLFFTKVVIDASNLLAVTFYDAIAPGALNAAGGFNLTQAGLANEFMNQLNLHTLYQVVEEENLQFGSIVTVGIMGSIMLVIAAFVFFVMAIMFIIRYVILILVLILSPIAFMAFVLPALEGQGDKWKNALIGQAFFAPIYFLLTWITLKVLGDVTRTLETIGGVTGNTTSALSGLAITAKGITDSGGALTMFINFIIVIVFLITSLVIAKQWANKAGERVSGLTKWASATAGGATFGLAGRLGRNVIGSRAATMADSDKLKREAAEGGIGARLQLATAKKLSTSSFDFRGTALGGQLEAGKARKGGFIRDQKDRAKTYGKYKPSPAALKQAQTDINKAKEKLEGARIVAEREVETRAPKPLKFIEAERQLKAARENALQPSSLVGLSTGDIEARRLQNDAAIASAEARVKAEKEKYERAKSPAVKESTAKERRSYAQNLLIKREMQNRMEGMAKRVEKNKLAPLSIPGGLFVSGQAKAETIRAAAKGQSAKDQAADVLKNLEKEGVITREEKPETPPSTPPPTPLAPPPENPSKIAPTDGTS